MSVHVATLRECLAAVGALVGLLPRVRPPVLREGAKVAEALLALSALIRPFASVNALVRLEAASLDEGLSAD